MALSHSGWFPISGSRSPHDEAFELNNDFELDVYTGEKRIGIACRAADDQANRGTST